VTLHSHGPARRRCPHPGCFCTCECHVNPNVRHVMPCCHHSRLHVGAPERRPIITIREVTNTSADPLHPRCRKD
jgi:hypothetical protein